MNACEHLPGYRALTNNCRFVFRKPVLFQILWPNVLQGSIFAFICLEYGKRCEAFCETRDIRHNNCANASTQHQHIQKGSYVNCVQPPHNQSCGREVFFSASHRLVFRNPRGRSLPPNIRCLFTLKFFPSPFPKAEQRQFLQLLLLCQMFQSLNYLHVLL